MSTPRHVWTPGEEAALAEIYPHLPTEWIATLLELTTRQVYQKATALGLKKSERYLNSPLAGRIRRDNYGGHATQFKPGITPWNKGTHYTAGGRSAETRFKPGERRGVAVNLYKPIGSERISKDGYLERKINDGMPLQKRWRAVHILDWEAVNGPLPAGHAIAFKDGNKENRALDNLECITRAELMRRNTYHQYPKEIARVVQLRGAITRQINKRERSST